MVAGAGSATTVFDSVSASRVPCHADHEAAVVAVVGWPPLLRVGHHGFEISLNCAEIERCKLCGVIKVIVHGVRGWVALMEDSKIELFWPPHVVGNSRRWSIRTVDDGALIRHHVSLFGLVVR